MKDINLRREVLFSSYKALLGNITRNMTLISIRWSRDSYYMRVFLNTTPTNDDIEIVKEITTEICADLPFIVHCKEEVHKWNNDKSELLDETIFLTREHLNSH